MCQISTNKGIVSFIKAKRQTHSHQSKYIPKEPIQVRSLLQSIRRFNCYSWTSTELLNAPRCLPAAWVKNHSLKVLLDTVYQGPHKKLKVHFKSFFFRFPLFQFIQTPIQSMCFGVLPLGGILYYKGGGGLEYQLSPACDKPFHSSQFNK